MHTASSASWPLRKASRLITCRRSARRRRCRRRSKNSTNSCWAPMALSGLRLSSVSVSRLTSSLVSWVWARPAFLARPTRKCTAAPVPAPIAIDARASFQETSRPRSSMTTVWTASATNCAAS